MRVLRIVLRIAAWLAILPAAFVFAAWVHLHTKLARRIARDEALVMLDESIQGSIRVGYVKRLDADHIVLHDVSVFDPQGRRVIYADRLSANPDLFALARGTIRFDDV